MNWMPIADEIKARLTMPDIFARYGFEPNRNGFLRCPFHDEKTASLSAYDGGRRWKCFGCGKQGDVISFVMELYGIGFGQALIRINDDFCMGLSASADRPEALRERREIAARKLRKEREKAALLAEMNELSNIRRRLWWARVNEAPKTPEEPLTPMFALSLRELDWLDWRIRQLFDKWKEMG